MSHTPQRPVVIERLEGRQLFSVTVTTEYIKIPGPTDVQLNIAQNPAGHQVPGQTSVTLVPNRLAH